MNFQSVLNTQQQQYASLMQQQQQRHSSTPTKMSSTPAGGSFVQKIRQAPGKATPTNIKGSNNTGSSSSSSEGTPTSTPTRGSVGHGLLTQAKKETKGSNDSSIQHHNSSEFVSASINGPSTTGAKWVVNERRLAQWQQQPHNLSPATHLNLEPMLPPPRPEHKNKPLLVLDVDETLVHASFTPAKPFHVKITIHVDGESGDIFVAYRPHLFTFLDAILPLFEVAIFTASQSCYADQLMDAIDPQGRLGRLRLFREHCTEVNGARVKDLSLLGRSLHRVALIDNSPVTYLFQPRNAIPILSWFDDPRDTELLKLLPMLRQLAQAPSVYDVLDLWNCSQK